MSYEITFKDRTSIMIETERGERVKQLWLDGKKDTPIEIDDNAYLIGMIAKIEYAADPVKHAEPLTDESKLIEQKKCRGTNSIQNEINHIIRHDYPADWAKRIKSEKFREAVRMKLRQANSEGWCDYREGECACA